METNTFSTALSDSIKNEKWIIDSDVLEFGLDAFMKDGILKDIPIVSAVMTTFKIGKSIHELNYIKKICIFLQNFNNGICDEKMFAKILERLNGEKADKEVEYLLLYIDRYIEDDKPAMLAKLYIAYLMSKINWLEMTKYTAVIDRFLPGDYEKLCELNETIGIQQGEQDALYRLTASGLVFEKQPSLFEDFGKGYSVTSFSTKKYHQGVCDYQRTQFGDKLIDVLENN